MPEEVGIEEEAVVEESELLTFVKSLLGFYGSGVDTTLAPLILAAQQYMANAGVPVMEPPGEEDLPEGYDQHYALYKLAVATQVKITHDGDIKGDLMRTLTTLILSLKDYSGGETL